MKLEKIGFYTLSDERAKTASLSTPLKRCELLLTDKCNLKCPYCRPLDEKMRGEMPLSFTQYVLQLWVDEGLENVRFSGGEPTLYQHLKSIIKGCRKSGVKRIALSTNGTQELDFYKELVDCGVNDFSISLDGGCCAVNKAMNGGKETFKTVTNNIKYLSWYNYVTVGIVFNEVNVERAKETIEYVDSLNPSDIRIISSAQYNKALNSVANISKHILNRNPILKYRVNNYQVGRHIRGISKSDTHRCHLVKDDVAVAGNYHFPCIIYLREGGESIGQIRDGFRKERINWFNHHNTKKDSICRKNCLDVCVDYNNKAEATSTS